MGGIKQPPLEKGRNIDVRYSSDIPPDSLHPAFCFKHLKRTLGFPEDKKQRNHIINILKKLGERTWAQIKSDSFKDGCGFELLPQLNDKSPVELSKDAKVIGFYCSDSGRMIGYRDAKIFYVFWFDWSPFKKYKH